MNCEINLRVIINIYFFTNEIEQKYQSKDYFVNFCVPPRFSLSGTKWLILWAARYVAANSFWVSLSVGLSPGRELFAQGHTHPLPGCSYISITEQCRYIKAWSPCPDSKWLWIITAANVESTEAFVITSLKHKATSAHIPASFTSQQVLIPGHSLINSLYTNFCLRSSCQATQPVVICACMHVQELNIKLFLNVYWP